MWQSYVESAASEHDQGDEVVDVVEAVGHADGDLDPVVERLEPGAGAARFDGAWDVGAASPDFFGKLDDLGDAAMRGPEHLRIISSVLADHPRSCGANVW